MIGTGRLANAAIPKEVRTFVALGPLQVIASENGELKGTAHTYRALFEPCLVNAAMFTVAGPWSCFFTSSLYSND